MDKKQDSKFIHTITQTKISYNNTNKDNNITI